MVRRTCPILGCHDFHTVLMSASKALDTLDGKVIDSAPISLQFCERRAGSRGHPPEAPSPDVVYQTTEAELEATYAKVEATTPELLTSEVEISASITESQCRYTVRVVSIR